MEPELGSEEIDERAFRGRVLGRGVFVCVRVVGERCVGRVFLGKKLCYGGYAEGSCTTCDLFPPGTAGDLGLL